MSRLAISVLILLLLQPATAQPDPGPFEATYSIRFSIAKGEAQVSLRRSDNGEFIYDSLTEPKGFIGIFVKGHIRETSRFTMRDGTLTPLHYKRVDSISSDERDLEIHFDWNQGVAVTQFGGNSEEVQLTPASIDPGLLPIAVMHDLSVGDKPGPYTLVERGRLEQIDVGAEGEETLSTKAGRYNALVYAHAAPDENRLTRLWAAPALGNLMLQMAQYKGDKERAKLTLKSVEFLQEPAD